MLDDHVVEEGKGHDEIGLQGFYFNIFEENEEGLVRKVFSWYPYLLMLMKLWPGYFNNQLERVDIKLDE